MVFNVLAVNNDDHTKNASFLLREGGRWELALAHDITHAYRPDSEWVREHQMPVNGRFDGTTRADVQRDAGASSRGRPALRRKRPQPLRGTWLSAGGCSGRRVATKRVVRQEPQIAAGKSRAGQG